MKFSQNIPVTNEGLTLAGRGSEVPRGRGDSSRKPSDCSRGANIERPPWVSRSWHHANVPVFHATLETPSNARRGEAMTHNATSGQRRREFPLKVGLR